jgi:hypothetical protein
VKILEITGQAGENKIMEPHRQLSSWTVTATFFWLIFTLIAPTEDSTISWKAVIRAVRACAVKARGTARKV